MSKEKNQKQYNDSFFDMLLDWVSKYWQILTVVLLALIIGWQAYSGMYDFRSLTRTSRNQGA